MKSCTNHSPPDFVGHWRDWHRGHGCDKDDGKPRSAAAKIEIVQIAANEGAGFLTDAQLNFLRTSTTSGDTLRVRALDELAARRADAGPTKFCSAIDTWAELLIKAKVERGTSDASSFAQAWREVRQAITKSCLLDRMLYHGEQPSQTPCPVHKGIWSGLHCGWPGQLWSDGRSVDVDEQLQAWHAAGCRCYLHGCGCTTGWNSDTHCGCIKQDVQR